MSTKTHDLGNDNIYLLVARLSIPAILSMLVAAGYNMVDRIFVGNINPLYLTAIGITMPFQIVQMAFVLLIGVGSSTLISINYGKNDLKSAERLLNCSLKMIVVTLLFVTVICIVFMDNIFKILGVSQQIYSYAKNYIFIIILFSVPSLAGYCLNNSVRSLGFSKESMMFVTTSTILNIILDYVFVIVLDMDVRGAAIATVISQSLVTLYVIYFFSSRDKKSPIKLKWKYLLNSQSKIDTQKNQSHYVREIISNGLPNFYMQVFGTFVNIFLNKRIIKYGSDYQMATITIISSISMIFTMMCYGISQGTQAIIGYNFGNKKIYRSIKALKIALFSILSFSFTGLILLELFPKFFVHFFTSDEALKALTAHNLRIYLLGLPMIGVHSIATTFLQSIKKPRLSTILYVLRFGAILVPSLLVLPNIFGIDGVYMSNALSDIVAGVVSIIILKRVIKYDLEEQFF